jgi:hypothetical protein
MKKLCTLLVLITCPSVCLSLPLFACISVVVPLDGLPRNLILETFMKVCRQNSKLLEIGRKCHVRDVKT